MTVMMKVLPSCRKQVTAGQPDSIRMEMFKETDKQRLAGSYSEKPGKAALAFNIPVKVAIYHSCK